MEINVFNFIQKKSQNLLCIALKEKISYLEPMPAFAVILLLWRFCISVDKPFYSIYGQFRIIF